MKRPNLLICLPQLGGGGAEMHILRLLPHLNLSWDITVVALREGGRYRSLFEQTVPIRACLPPWAPSSAARALLAARPLSHIIRQTRPDLILSLVEPAIASVGLVLGKLPVGQRPLHCVGLQNNLEMMMANLPLPSRHWLPRIVTGAYRRADHIIALSDGAACGLNRLLPSTTARTTVIPNAGHDKRQLGLAQFAPVSRAPRHDVFVACGRLTAQKDYPTLLRAFALVANRHPSAHLEILGEGEQRNALERLASRLRIQNKVHFIGFRANPLAYMISASGLILSSRWEGFANVITEAMACGTPVVATDCPYGPAELLENGRFGQLVPVGDTVRLAEAIGKLLTEKEQFRLLAEQAREHATRYEAEAVAKRYDDHLSSLIPLRSCA